MKKNMIIKEKRIKLGLTPKEFADALKMGLNGEKTLRKLENGDEIPSDELVNKILSFALDIPFKSVRHEFKFIDLFAGIGGIRLPFQELGGKCVFTSEWDKYAQKTYSINFGEVPSGDITSISPDAINDFDILLAGFPCQPFSQAGLKKGFSDTRGTLFFQIEQILAVKKPKAFLLENVKQLRGHDKGRTLNVILQHLNDLGYFVDYEVLRAADFGIPQNRERIFIIGFDKSQVNIKDNYKFPFPKPTLIETRLGNILEKDVDDKYTISNRLWEGHVRRKREHIAKGNGFGYTLYNEDSKYTNTLSARYYKDGSEILINQGPDKNPRKLTPRECARLQGFPEEFIIPVSDTQAYKQFGNSVAIPVVSFVAKQLLKELKRLSINKL